MCREAMAPFRRQESNQWLLLRVSFRFCLFEIQVRLVIGMLGALRAVEQTVIVSNCKLSP